MPVTERAVEQKFLIAVDFGMWRGASRIGSTQSAHQSLGTTFSSVVWQHTGEVKIMTVTTRSW